MATSWTTPVKPLIKEWKFAQDVNGYSGTRLYLTTTNDDSTAVELPVIGDQWDTTYTNVTVKRIDVSFTCERNNTYKTYTISYDSYVDAQVQYNNQGNNMELLPLNMDLSCDYNTFNNPTADQGANFWGWTSAPTVRLTGQTILKPVPMESFVIVRYVYGTNLRAYNDLARKCVQKVNTYEMMKFPIATVRFDGAQFEEVKNNARYSERKWLVSLKFTARLEPLDTWQHLYNPITNKYEEIVFGPNAEKLYGDYDLTSLFTFGQSSLGTDPVFPNQ